MTPQQAADLLEAVPVPLVLIGRDERVIALNDPARSMLGVTATGTHYITLLRAPVLLDCVEAALADGRRHEARFPTRDRDRDATYSVVGAPCAAGVLLSLQDVSDVQAAGEMRRDFVANASHELRTPLTALSGFIETLQGPARDDPEAQARFLPIMAREAARMNRLIEDLLSLGRVEAQARVRPTGHVDVAALAASAIAALDPLAKDAGVTVRLGGADAPIEVPGDADQLSQVFANLLENAVKYGGDTVWVDLTPEDRDPALRGPALRIEVRDNGPGIPAHHLPRLTERFYRIDDHRSREVGGTGLGLAIVKHIVNRHRGRLRVQSEPGQGSRFTLVLPR